jgi:Endonuclease NucS
MVLQARGACHRDEGAMSDIKLFRIKGSQAEALQGTSVAVERSLQVLIEKHLEVMLGVRLLASEYRTGKTHGGRIDTLGIDENGSPVIIEYKRASNEAVINQGLYYLDWLLDHKAEFVNRPGKGGGSRTRRMEPWQITYRVPSGGTRPSFGSGQSGCTSKR